MLQKPLTREKVYTVANNASQHTFVMFCHPWDYLPDSICYFEYFYGSVIETMPQL
jgi:hypothetical protein